MCLLMQFSAVQELMSHAASVTCVVGVYQFPSNQYNGESQQIRTLIAAASGDSTVSIWERPNIGGEQRVKF